MVEEKSKTIDVREMFSQASKASEIPSITLNNYVK